MHLKNKTDSFRFTIACILMLTPCTAKCSLVGYRLGLCNATQIFINMALRKAHISLPYSLKTRKSCATICAASTSEGGQAELRASAGDSTRSAKSSHVYHGEYLANR